MGADTVAVAGGHAHVLFLKADGTVYGTGKNGDGQLGDGSQSVRLAPVQLTLLGSDNSAITAGVCHSAFMKSDGRVFAVGCNSVGQLGDGTQTLRTSPVQVVAMGSDTKAVSAGGYHTVYLKADGRVFASGQNMYGQLGDETTTQRSTPVEMATLSSSNTRGILRV